MAICFVCQGEMSGENAVFGCSKNLTVEFPDGSELSAIAHHDDLPCHDCNVNSGHNHHPGCDMEQCPKCGGQIISCECLDDNQND